MDDDKAPPNDGGIQSRGRQANAAKPLDAAPANAGAERYPPVSKDDSIERTGRTRQVTGKKQGFDGEQGDPVEGKR